MKKLLAAGLLCASILPSLAFATPYAYVHSSVGEPWGRSDNINTMNSELGAANVETLLYESVDPGVLFSGTRDMIFMTGGDDNSPALGTFIGANQTTMETWVSNGGSLMILAAENSGGLSNLGFGASWVSGANADGVVTDASHAIFAGTGLSDGSVVNGSAFHHDLVSGLGFTTLMTSTAGGIILMEQAYGAGHIIIGTLTANFFATHASWDQPESAIIHANLINYAAGLAGTVPLPAPIALMLVGLAYFSVQQRRKHAS